MSLFLEMRRRHVFRAAVAYTVVWWLLVQVAGLLLDAFEAPPWIFQGLILLLAAGFPVAMVLAWFFELTPSGLVRSDGEDEDDLSAATIRGYLNPIVIGMLSAAVILFALDKFVWTDDPLIEAPMADSVSVRTSSLAVLPFSNRSSVAEDAYFVDGIHDDILTLLAKIESFKVVSRTSVMRFRDFTKSVPEIGRELNVRYILEGGVQRAGKQVRINAQLIDARSDEHLWAETFDRELSTENLFAIQSEIARAIAAALDAELSPADEQQLDSVPTESLDAYDAYLLGRQSLLETGMEALEQAVAHFEQAVAIDGQFAGAFAGICEAHLSLYTKTGDTEYFDRAEAACNRALAIDGNLVEVHSALGRLFRHHGEYGRAETEQRKALATRPQNIEALIELGFTLSLQGRIREAEAVLIEAESLQPDHWPVHDALFTFYRNYDDSQDRFDRAVQHAMRVVELLPDSASAWNNLGTAYYSLQQYDAAKSAWDRALELEPTRTAFTNRGLQYYYEGRYADSAEMQSKAIELAPNDHRAWGRLAESYRLMGGNEAESRAAYATAIRLAEAMLEINEQDWKTSGLLATYYAQSDRPEDARLEIESALEISGRDPEALLYAALVANERGDVDFALQALEEMVEANEAFRLYIVDDPDLKSLQGNARFDRLTDPGAAGR
jgi:TolB-like protein/Flp pilus assembly protein TadD